MKNEKTTGHHNQICEFLEKVNCCANGGLCLAKAIGAREEHKTENSGKVRARRAINRTAMLQREIPTKATPR